jgi:hypothetical protein
VRVRGGLQRKVGRVVLRGSKRVVGYVSTDSVSESHVGVPGCLNGKVILMVLCFQRRSLNILRYRTLKLRSYEAMNDSLLSIAFCSNDASTSKSRKLGYLDNLSCCPHCIKTRSYQIIQFLSSELSELIL